MSNYQPRPGDFSLFRNDRKERDTHPDYTGQGVLPDGSEAWINAWLKETRDGKKFFSISVKPKEAKREDSFPGGGGGSRQQSSGSVAGNRGGRGSFEDDPDSIPFVTSEGIR